MNEHLVRLSLDQKLRVRIVCVSCGTVVEVGITDLSGLPSCPKCRMQFHDSNPGHEGISDVIGYFGKVVNKLLAQSAHFRIEFEKDATK